jgi:hypothetical protein
MDLSMRRPASSFVVLALSLLMTACTTTPTTIPATPTIPALPTMTAPPKTITVTTITAVFLDSGLPTVIVHPCADAIVVGITVTDTSTGASTASPGSPSANRTVVELWSVAGEPGANAISQMHLLQTPPGWHVQPGIKDLITEFRPEHAYWVIAHTTDPSHPDGGVSFRLSDLASLTDGQVWARSRPLGQASGMTRDQFLDYATSNC